MNEADDYLNMMKKATAMRGSELKSQFKTMLFTYRNALGMLSGLKNELDEVVNHIDNLDIETISNFYKPVLEKANDLVSKIEDLEDDIKNHTDMKAYLSSIKTQLKSHNIDTWVRKLDEVKYQIVKAKENEIRREREAKEAEERRKEELQRQRNEEAKRQAELERKRREEIVIIDGLSYQNQPFTKEYTWEEAKKYAKNLRLGGYDDWRLPTKEELNKISNIKMHGEYDDNWKNWFENNKHKRIKNSKGYEYFIRKEFSENMPERAFFWSITEYNNDSSNAWYVDFYVGNDSWNVKSFEFYVLCVRGQ
jgi:uncharacterized protein (TIGR02145 family)